MANLSTFPTTVDSFIEHVSASAADAANIALYQQLIQTPNLTPTQQTQLANLTTTLRSKLFFSDDLNLLQDAVLNLENFFLNEVDGYIQTKQSDFDATVNKFSFQGVYNPSTTYMEWNTVQYNGQSYICTVDNTVGIAPPTGSTISNSNWALIAQQGIQGPKGDTGQNGIGLVFQGTYDNTKVYNVNDAVAYNGSLYGCIKQTVAGTNPTNGTYWDLAVAQGTTNTITTLNNTVTLSSASSNVPIGIAQFNSSTDVLWVYENSTFIALNQDWVINANGTSIDKKDGTTWASGTTMNFVVLKNMQNGLIYTDGTMLQANTVSNNALATDAKVGSLAKLQTSTKTDVVSAINEVLGDIPAITQKAVNSGVIDYTANFLNGGGIPSNGQVQTLGTQYFTANAFCLGNSNTLINGALLNVNHFGVSPTVNYNQIDLDAPPSSNVTPSLTGSARDDLVFLEAWQDAGGAGWKWHIRVVDGVDFGTYMADGFCTNLWIGWTGVNYGKISPQGGNASPVASASGANTSFVSVSLRNSSLSLPTPSNDSGLYVAGDGSSTAISTLQTLDGYVYAIPLFRVRRRNSGAFDPDTNPLGGKQYYTTVGTFGTWAVGTSQTLTLTASAPNTMAVGDILCSTSSNTAYFQVTAINGTSVTVTVITATTSASSATFYPRSDRPDGLYSNIIDASDIIDLRHQVSLTGFDKKVLLALGMNKLLRGQLTTNQQVRYGRDYIGLNTSAYTDDANTLLFLKFDGSINGTANGSAVTGTAVGTASYPNGVHGNGLSGANAYWNITSTGSTVTTELFLKPATSWASLGSSYGVLKGFQSAGATGNTSFYIYVGSTGTLYFTLYDANGTLQVSVSISASFVKAGDWHYVKMTYNGSTLTGQIDEVTNSVSYSQTIGTTVSAQVYSSGAAVGTADLLRISNIVRTGTPLPSGFSYANGDRILDGPNADFSFWSDDVGGTAGSGGRTNPYGLSRVPNQVAGRISYNGSEIRHYYGQGITAGWGAYSSLVIPTGAFDNSAEYISVAPTQPTGDGTTTVFTYNAPTNLSTGSLFVLHSTTGLIGQAVSGSIGISSIAYNTSTGVTTVTFASAPANGAAVGALYYTAGARHAHFIPSTKGFIIHDWHDDQLSGNGTAKTFNTAYYNVTSVNHIRVGGVIQNGGYSVSGLNASTTLTAQANASATTISVASASNFVANQPIAVSKGDGTWYTTTITSISGNTITIPAISAGVTLPQNASIQGAALVTFTTAPASGTNNIDIVYESILTPALGDNIRVFYQHVPYNGLLGTPFAGSGKYQIAYVDESAGFLTTLGTGTNSTPSVPAWMKDYISPSTQLPINGYDYQLKHDTITLSNNTVTNASQQFVTNEQVYAQNDSSSGNIYSPSSTFTPTTQTNRGYFVSGLNDGVSGRVLDVALRDISSSIPHLAGFPLLVQDTSSGELMLMVATMFRTDATNRIQSSASGFAMDIFKINGRPLTKSYGNVTA